MEHPASANDFTIGARLSKARVARSLSIDEVARSLKLSPRIISALEEDAYDRLPGPTYVRGYLRGYALLLGLSAQQLIDGFNNLPQAAQRADMTAPAPVREASSSDALMRFGTVLVAVIVFGLAALWWSGKDGSTRRRPAPAATAPSSSETPARAPEAAAEPEPAPVPETPAKAEPPVKPAERPAVAAAPAASPEAVATPPPLDPNAPRAHLTLRVSEDSWADVRDAQERRLLYETIPAGRVVNVEGAAPLSVFLGNVEGVSVEFNGQPYDALRHRRGLVARFTLGSSGGN